MNIPQHQIEFMKTLGLPLNAEGLSLFSKILDAFKKFREADRWLELELSFKAMQMSSSTVCNLNHPAQD